MELIWLVNAPAGSELCMQTLRYLSRLAVDICTPVFYSTVIVMLFVVSTELGPTRVHLQLPLHTVPRTRRLPVHWTNKL